MFRAVQNMFVRTATAAAAAASLRDETDEEDMPTQQHHRDDYEEDDIMHRIEHDSVVHNVSVRMKEESESNMNSMTYDSMQRKQFVSFLESFIPCSFGGSMERFLLS